MSRISQDFINNIGYLYEEINIQQNDFLNEESEYYDQEAAELVEDIILSLALTMFSEGCNAESFVKFLANTDEDSILEKYLSTDVDFILEEKIYSDFVEEQLELLESVGLLKLLGKGAKAIASGAKATKSAIKTGVTKAATSGVESKIGKKLVTNKGPNISGPFKNVSGRTGSAADRRTAALEKLSKRKATQAGVEVPKGPLSPSQATDLIKQARTAKALKGVKSAAKNVGIFGLGAAGGFAGAKLAGAGSGEKTTGAPKPSPTSTPSAPSAPSAPSSSAPSGGGGTGGGGGGSAPSGAPAAAKPKASVKNANQQYKDLIKAGKTKEAEKLGLETWAKAKPKLAAKLDVDGTQKGTGQSQMEKDAEELRRMSNMSKQRQGALMGGPEGPGSINKKDVEDAMKAEQERQKKKLEQEKSKVTTKESYEPYEVLLEYLLSGGHADTIEEAHYIMLEMDASAVRAVMEEYEDYLLAEEVSEWVDGLLSEGYDLSQYTWDDVVEHYVTNVH